MRQSQTYRAARRNATKAARAMWRPMTKVTATYRPMPPRGTSADRQSPGSRLPARTYRPNGAREIARRLGA